MTNDEAINTLKNAAWLGWSEQAEKVSEAVRMAVEALKTQLPKEDTTSDCISRQEAIRIASGYCHPANIAKELAKLPSVQPELQWIPVTERLPEKTQLCLVTEKTVVGLETCTRCFNKRNGGGFWSGWGHTDVIAWMPLPEPWKEGEQE